MNALPPGFSEAIRDLYLSRDGDANDFEAEFPTIHDAVQQILGALGNSYTLVRPLGRGGAGIVFELYDNALAVPRALKIPRPRQSEILETVHNEIEHLRALQHPYLISVYAAGEVPIDGYASPYPYFVMDYIDGAQDLEACVRARLELVAHARDLAALTTWLAATVHRIAQALAFLHDRHTLHFDVKPGNVLVNPEGQPILSDLGFAKLKSDSTDEVVVGFTLFYAHPDLRTAYEHMSSQNRVRRRKAPGLFRYAWDIYAFGRTILHVLAMVQQRLPDAVMYDYTFVYLHLMACRMLDGRNLSEDETDRIRSEQVRRGEPPTIYPELWLTFERRDLEELRYLTVDSIVEDFGKLQDRRYFLRRIPELNPHYPHSVQVSVGNPAPFSPRVKKIAEHPVFLRLNSAKQLGVADLVYPSCTHSRLEHSLGVFRTCWLYLQSLLNDPYNPLFLQLTSEEDLTALLLAALLHDLGQYPLAHDLEDAAPHAVLLNGKTWKETFRHESLSLRWLESASIDAGGHTIRDIRENREWGWNTPVARVAELVDEEAPRQLTLSRPGVKLRLLRSVISGPVDVDKVDYLVRDSKRADLPYGSMIDIARLARSLTVVMTHDDGKTLLTLGVYEKGQSAAEAITFVRYQLYQVLYWHHTVRAIRPMLREVLRQIPRDKRRNKKTCDEAFLALLGIDGVPGQVTVDDVLRLLRGYTSDVGADLVDMIRARRFYKRVLTVHSELEEEGKESFLQRFREAASRVDFDAALQKEIREAFDQYSVGIEGPTPSALAAPQLSVMQEQLSLPGRILCDCPSPRTGSSERLRLALEPKRRLQNYASRHEVAERVSEVWQQVAHRLMGIASKGRVYCHPNIRDPLMAALGPGGVRSALERVVARVTA